MNNQQDSRVSGMSLNRRSFLTTLGVATAAGLLGFTPDSNLAYADALSKEQREKMTPDEIIGYAKMGNERFRAGLRKNRDFLREQMTSAKGQHPAAVVLSCVDSRAPAEIILDLGIGDMFNSRVAGNIANEDILGSLEFACAVAGSKVVLVMGHTACGAIKGAIDKVQLGHLTGLLEKIRPAVEATQYDGERTSKNDAFVNAVARKNVELTIAGIRAKSPLLKELETKGSIKIVGTMYDLGTAGIEFIS
ncbi:MAG: twin-arginine translocation signal domain-containing protein [Nitrospira sp.]|nr:MAG: twin-arginine translocation signal domain-containing protein [Nitrospira sp.]